VEVRDGRPVAARAIETTEPLPLALFFPIDSLFSWAIREAERGGFVSVAYDQRLSYPAELVVGTLANDAGVAYSVSAVVPAPD
ncbi:MAG: DUF6174 domain-containing protein, partial [Gemmatimonadaceae bacterium]